LFNILEYYVLVFSLYFLSYVAFESVLRSVMLICLLSVTEG
jgi:hypothetical protein